MGQTIGNLRDRRHVRQREPGLACPQQISHRDSLEAAMSRFKSLLLCAGLLGSLFDSIDALPYRRECHRMKKH
jgi:hypothetical protein